MGAERPPLLGSFTCLAEALAAAAAQYDEHEAYVDGAERLSYREWVRRARALAGELARRGVGAGDVVALMLPSGNDFAVGYAATTWLGAVVTGLNTRLGQREVDAILDRAQPAIVIRDADASLPSVSGPFPVLDRGELRAAYTSGDPGPEPTSVATDAAAVIVWTSGTTGLPKGAWYDHANLAAAASTAGVMSAPFDRKLVATPFAHAGYMAKVWDQVAWGTTFVVSEVPWTAAGMARILRDERISVAGGVPTQWAKLLDEPTMHAGEPLKHLRVGIAATAPASPELVRRTAELIGVPLVVRYAMTESPSICGTEPTDPPEVQATTVGRPQEGMAVAVVDDAGEAVPAGTVGRIRIHGPAVMRGYWNDPEQTAQALDADGWLRSGDLGFLTPAGNLSLVGRSGDMYIRGGYNVYPLEVENVLAEHPQVDRAAVVGLPTPVIGEIGVCFVVPVDAADPPTREQLRAWVRERLADYKAPDRLELVGELPLTAMLKVDRAALLRQLESAGPVPDQRPGRS